MKSRVMRLLTALTLGIVATCVHAADLVRDRDTSERVGQYTTLTVASNVVIYAGSMVAASNGYAVAAENAAGLSVIGRGEDGVDNRGVNYLATKRIKIKRGVFNWANADGITAADIGKLAYVTDNQTVNKGGGGQNIIAGSIVDVDALGVWVDTGKIGPIGAATPTSLAVSGNATVTGTIGVTGTATFTNIVVNGATVTMPNLPASTNGLTAGMLYLSSGAIKVF